MDLYKHKSKSASLIWGEFVLCQMPAPQFNISENLSLVQSQKGRTNFMSISFSLHYKSTKILSRFHSAIEQNCGHFRDDGYCNSLGDPQGRRSSQVCNLPTNPSHQMLQGLAPSAGESVKDGEQLRGC